METPNFLDKYKKTKLKLDFPQINEIKETFKFELDEDENVLEQIRMEIFDRIFIFTEKIIEPLISDPDGLSSYIEQGMIEEEQRDRLFKLYSKIQMIKWENNRLAIDSNEREILKWIKKTWEFWNEELKDELTLICKTLSKSWSEIKENKDQLDYLH
ncbi:hypothetical protein ACFLQN_03060 [Candidatus Aenigmatarchaeota archaeon]